MKSRALWSSLLTLTLLGTTACKFDLGQANETDSLKNLDFNQGQLVAKEDSKGRNTLEGTGPLFSKSALSRETSSVRIQAKAVFRNAGSYLSVYSHSKADFSEAYEFRFIRLGDQVRVITTIHNQNSSALGIVATAITDWSRPVEFILEVDNTGTRPKAKIWAGGDSSLEPTLEEERLQNYPQGNRVGANLTDMTLYSFRVTELSP